MDLIIYHSQCLDGFCAAWIAKRRYPEAELMEAAYTETPAPIERVAGKRVLIVDFSFKRPDLLAMKERATNLMVLDHHKSSQAELADLPFCLFDMERSGAGITWDFLFPGRERPRLVNYVEDRDLWRFALPGSNHISRALGTYPLTDESMNELAAMLEGPGGQLKLIEIGQAIDRYVSKLVEGCVRNARLFTIGDHEVLGTEAPHALRNDVAHELAKGRAFGVVYQVLSDGTVVYSLRTDKGPGSIDVSEICRSFGGGGHSSAAGFIVKTDLGAPGFPWKPIPRSEVGKNSQ